MNAASNILRALALALCVCTRMTAQAEEAFDKGAVFSFLEENDLVVDTDRHYTQGIKFSFLHRDNQMPGWLLRTSQRVAPLGFDAQAHRLGYAVGQNIYTPANTQARELVRDDRPYAGWLYGSLVLHRRGLTGGTVPTLESLQIDLGIIGPGSLAHEAQRWVHELRDLELPRGWQNQLKNEPGLALKYVRALRLSLREADNPGLDLIPYGGASLGNVETSARLGFTARLGINLPQSFGVPAIRSLWTPEGGVSSTGESSWGAYVFIGAEGAYVAYTTFLDGNLYRASHDVPRKPWVTELKGGIAFVLKRVEVAVSYIYLTPEFKGQELDHGYGSLSMKLLF